MNRIATFMAGAIVAAASSFAQAEELKLAHFVSTKHPYHENLFVWLGDRVAENSNGELTIRVFPGGELGAAPAEQFNRAIDGITDLSFVVQGYTANSFPGSLIMELPGALPDTSSGAAAFERALPLIEDEYRRVKLLGLWNIDPGVLYTRDTPVRSLEDLAGLKIRVGSKSSGDLVEAWGATPVFMPITEMYTAIQTGVVDGAHLDPGAGLAFRLSEVTNYLTLGFDSTVPVFAMVMNRRSWDNLSAENQAALEKAAGLEFSQQGTDVWRGLTDIGFDQFSKTEGNEIIELSAEAAEAFNMKATEVREASLDELEADGIPAREILAAMRGN